MSDESGAAPGAPDAVSALTAGAILRGGREKAGLHIGALAVSLKVPVSKLEALEADRLDLLPDAVFARALASSVCRTLKLDAGPVLRMLPELVTPPLRLDARLGNTSYDAAGMTRRLPPLSSMPTPVVVSAGLLFLAALVLLLFPSLERTKTTLAPEGVVPAAGVAPDISRSSAPIATPSILIVATPAAVESTAVAAAGSVDTLASTPVVTQKVDGQTVGAGLVVFRTRALSWVEVTDARGVVQLRKTMGSGETAAASGTLPLSVTVGRVDSIDVLVRGQTFDLAPIARDNVARFQVK